jgi:hypothetical protein
MRRIPATRDCARALLDIAPERQRAECRVLAAPMARQQTKKLAAVTTGSAKSAGIPCAMVLTVSFVLSPGTGLYCLRHCAVRHRTTWCQRRGTRTTRFRRPRRHRSSAHTRYARHRVHRIPAPRIVTISRNAPLGERGTGRIMLLISGKVKLLRKIRTSSVNSASRPARRCPAHWHVARTCVHARDRRRAPPHPCVPRPR